MSVLEMEVGRKGEEENSCQLSVVSGQLQSATDDEEAGKCRSLDCAPEGRSARDDKSEGESERDGEGPQGLKSLCECRDFVSIWTR